MSSQEPPEGNKDSSGATAIPTSSISLKTTTTTTTYVSVSQQQLKSDQKDAQDKSEPSVMASELADALESLTLLQSGKRDEAPPATPINKVQDSEGQSSTSTTNNIVKDEIERGGEGEDENEEEKCKSDVQFIFQDACALHRYTRSTDISYIFERPERLRAVKIGAACAWAKLNNNSNNGSKKKTSLVLNNNLLTTPMESKDKDKYQLASALGKLSIAGHGTSLTAPSTPAATKTDNSKAKMIISGHPFDILKSNASVSLVSKCVNMVHNAENDEVVSTPKQEEAEEKNIKQEDDETDNVFNTTTKISRTGGSSGDSKRLYGAQLLDWILRSSNSPSKDNSTSEVPAHLSQGDLYWCPESKNAVEGALGAICQAVDANCVDGNVKVVSVRPPGHHCGSASPSGFCLVNNVLVGVAHAHVEHKVNRAIIIDIDLHHGNGTQEIARRINAESWQRKQLAGSCSPIKTGRSPSSRKQRKDAETIKDDTLQVFYGSLHDIWSYPCEDGDPGLVADASMNIAGAHGQWITNVHLKEWKDEHDFHTRVYPEYARQLLGSAREFATMSKEEDEQVLVWLSLGLDASEHEDGSMSRHSRNVPTSFFRRMAADIRQLSRDFGSGLVCVLEGGYSDCALATGMAATLEGLSLPPESAAESAGGRSNLAGPSWSGPDLKGIERMLRRKSHSHQAGSGWEGEASRIFSAMMGEQAVKKSSRVESVRRTSTRSAAASPQQPPKVRWLFKGRPLAEGSS